MEDERKKKIAIISVCSLVLVAMVVALTVGTRDNEDSSLKEIASSQKAITTICQSTDYQDACKESLKNAENSTSDPKELIEMAFNATKKYIKEAAENSTLVQDLEKDPKAKSALDNCLELVDRAINDLERSYAKFSNFDVMNWDSMLEDLKIWLSGAITYQETCLDGFEGVPGDAGEKMRTALTKAMQMTSNGLAMVTEISTFLESMGSSAISSKRRLLSERVIGHGDDFPDWLDLQGRKLLSSQSGIRPNLTVAQDGSGNFKTINEALEHIPKNGETMFILYIKEGIYQETVRINSSLTHLLMIGDGPNKTRITGNLNFIDGTSTYHTATVAVQGDGFMAKNIAFENSAGAAKHQAVALRVSADRAVFYNCQMDGYQDTLYAHTYRQFYKDCVISGTIDFIFGDSAAVFQGCTLLVRKPLDNQQNIVTAQGRKDVRQPTGLVLQNCTFKADPEYYPLRHKIKSYLGRPWKEYSRTIVMESFIDDLIQPQGWLPWNESFALDTLFYTEFNNRGPASSKKERVKWAGVKELPAKRIQRFTVNDFLDGNRWIEPTGVPFAPGFIFPLPEENEHVKYSPVVPEETKDLGSSKDKSAYIPKPPPPPPKSENDDKDQKDDNHKDDNKDDKEQKDNKDEKKDEDKHENEQKEKDTSHQAPVTSPVENTVTIAPITIIPDNSITIDPQPPIVAQAPQSSNMIGSQAPSFATALSQGISVPFSTHAPAASPSGGSGANAPSQESPIPFASQAPAPSRSAGTVPSVPFGSQAPALSGSVGTVPSVPFGSKAPAASPSGSSDAMTSPASVAAPPKSYAAAPTNSLNIQTKKDGISFMKLFFRG